MKILALDLSSKSGWALGSPLDKPSSGVWDLRGDGKPDHGRYLSALAGAIERTILSHRPDLVIMEAPMKAQARAAVAKKRGVPERDSTTRLLHNLCGVVEMICFEQRVRCEEEEVRTVRQAVLGCQPKGDPKVAVMSFCRMLGWAPADDNAGDALVLWEYRQGLERARQRTRMAS